MNRRLVSAMVLAASVCATQAVYAAPFHVNNPVHAATEAKGKMVKFSVRNDSSATLKLKAGDSEIAIAPGKTTDVKLPAGTQLICQETTPNYTAGAVIATVSDTLSGNTLALH